MESTSKLSALALPFGVDYAIKSWFGLLNLFLEEANHIVIAEYIFSSAFCNIAKSRELLSRQFLVITSLRSSILYTGRKLNNLPFESAGLADVRRADPLKVVRFPQSTAKQERIHAYQGKHNERLQFPQLKCGPPVVEPRPFNPPLFDFTYCESSTTSCLDKITVNCLKSPQITFFASSSS